jgi:hypothetical protein
MATYEVRGPELENAKPGVEEFGDNKKNLHQSGGPAANLFDQCKTDEAAFEYIQTVPVDSHILNKLFEKEWYKSLQYAIKTTDSKLDWKKVLSTTNVDCINELCKRFINDPKFITYIKEKFADLDTIKKYPWNSTHIWACLFRGGNIQHDIPHSVARRTRDAFQKADIKFLVAETCIPCELDDADDREIQEFQSKLKEASGFERLNLYLEWVASNFIPYLHKVHEQINVLAHPFVGMVAKRVMRNVDGILSIYAQCDVSATTPNYVPDLISITHKLMRTIDASVPLAP